MLKKSEDWAKEKGAATITGTLIPTPGSEETVIKLLQGEGYTIDKKGEVRKKL